MVVMVVVGTVVPEGTGDGTAVAVAVLLLLLLLFLFVVCRCTDSAGNGGRFAACQRPDFVGDSRGEGGQVDGRMGMCVLFRRRRGAFMLEMELAQHGG